jgi:hypothetical protein
VSGCQNLLEQPLHRLCFGGRKTIASSLSTGHPIHNRTIDANTPLLSSARRRRNSSKQLLREGQAGTEDQMASPDSKLSNYQRTQSSFVQAEFFVTSDHRDLFAHSLGDDLRVPVVWGGRKERTHDAPCRAAVCGGSGPQARPLQKVLACREQI